MVALPLLLALIQHHVGVANAFQPHAQIGFVGSPCSNIHELKLRRQWSPYGKSNYNRRSHFLLSATENDSSLEEMLEKFDMPLQFKKAGDVYKKDDSGNSNDAAPTSDDGDSGSKIETSSSTSDKLEVASPDKPTDAAAGFTPSADTPLANKYYLKKIQMTDEAKNTETTVEEKTSETTDVPTPAPPVTAPRRRFADFGVASEAAEPINGEATVQDPGTSSSEDPTSWTTKLRGFTDFSSGPARPLKVSIEGDESTSTSSSESKPLSDAAKPAADATKSDSIVKDTKEVVAEAEKPASVAKEEKGPDVSSSIKEENAPDASTVVKEENAPDSSTVVKEGKAPVASSAIKEEKAPAESSATKEEKAPTVIPSIKEKKTSPSPTESISQPSSGLIQTQPASPTNAITLPDIKLDVEDFGLLPLVIIGVSASLAVAVYLKPVNDNDVEKKGFVEESKSLLQKVKDAGAAGAVSYALWEAAFWTVAIPICLVSYNTLTGHWADFSNEEDVKQLGMEIFAFVNFARLAVPIRIGLALSTVPWVEENIIRRFNGGQVEDSEEEDLPSEQEFESMELSTEGYPGDTLQSTGEEDESFIYEYAESSLETQESVESEDEETLAITEVEKRLNKMEAEASRISSSTMANINAGIDPTLLEYCEPGQVDEDCSEFLQGYLGSLASTGAVATDGEVKTIVGYLDSLSSNITPNEKTGAAFTTYLDALSSGYIPPPSSAVAVANYLDALRVVTMTAPSLPTSATGEGMQPKDQTRINEVEERLSRLESSVSSLPDDIASRLLDWQRSQDKKLSDEMEKIMQLLVEK